MSNVHNPLYRNTDGVAMTDEVARAAPAPPRGFGVNKLLEAREHHSQTTGNKHSQRHPELQHALKAPMLAGRRDTGRLRKLFMIAGAALERAGGAMELASARAGVIELDERHVDVVLVGERLLHSVGIKVVAREPE